MEQTIYSDKPKNGVKVPESLCMFFLLAELSLYGSETICLKRRGRDDFGYISGNFKVKINGDGTSVFS